MTPGDSHRRLVFDRAAWRTQAACRGLDPVLFYPARGEDQTEARAVCAACEVRTECLEHALANTEQSGIWGGTSGRERRAIRKARRAASPGAAA